MESYYNIPDGCRKHDRCETCPFKDCVAPQVSGDKQSYMRGRYKKVLHLAWNRISSDIIAERTGLSESSVRRIIREQLDNPMSKLYNTTHKSQR